MARNAVGVLAFLPLLAFYLDHSGTRIPRAAGLTPLRPHRVASMITHLVKTTSQSPSLSLQDPPEAKFSRDEYIRLPMYTLEAQGCTLKKMEQYAYLKSITVSKRAMTAAGASSCLCFYENTFPKLSPRETPRNLLSPRIMRPERMRFGYRPQQGPIIHGKWTWICVFSLPFAPQPS